MNSELLSLGLDDATLKRQIKEGTRVRVRRGATRSPGKLTPEEEHLELVRATLALTTTPAVVSHLSAAVVHQLPVSRGRLTKVHLLREGPFRSSANGVVVRHGQPVVASAVVRGFPVTPLADTVIDAVRMLPFREGVAIADAALRQKVPRDQLLSVLASQLHRRGNPLVRKVLDFADSRAESAGESHARVQMALAGLPKPELQLVMKDTGGELRVDFAWPALRLVVEFDGFVKYGRALLGADGDLETVIKEEKRREVRIRRLGWWVERMIWSDLSTPEKVAAIVNDGIEAAAPLVRLHQNLTAA